MHSLNWNSRVQPFEFLEDFHPKHFFPNLIGADPSLIFFRLSVVWGRGDAVGTTLLDTIQGLYGNIRGIQSPTLR